MGTDITSESCPDLSRIVPAMAGTFKALGDLTRLRIVYLLATDTSGTLGVGELAARLDISQPAVSQHLKTLRAEGLVDSRREGFYIYYTIDRERMVEFREHFELLYASVMERCSRELVRRTTRDRNVRACLIFYSYSGITRGVAEGFRSATGCDLVEVRAKKAYTPLSVFTTGILRSRRMVSDPVEPEEIDVSGYDLVILGTPVWAGRATPAINGAVKALKGCEGKTAVVFSTYLNEPGEALANLGRMLAERGVRVTVEVGLGATETKQPDAGGELLRRIIEADPFRNEEPRGRSPGPEET
jgi:DNA-binding transcriptional ArsR family regulator/flavodoxin